MLGCLRSSIRVPRVHRHVRNLSSSGPKQVDYLDLDRKYVMHPYTSMTDPLPVYPVASAKGVHIKLENGAELVDGMSSWWCAVHGYRHPVLDKAILEQVGHMSHVMFGGLTHKPAATLCELIVKLTPKGLNKVFLCDSGSVSVEVAMKMATQYWYTLGLSKKQKFLTIRNGYHGDTFGAMSVCDPVGGMHSMFRGVLASQIFENCPEDASDEAAMIAASAVRASVESRAEEIAAVIVEPIVQGAGGMRVYSPKFLAQIREICDEFNVLLIFDEIATGFGRTGTLFACEQTSSTYNPTVIASSGQVLKPRTDVTAATVPDIMCLGKALTGGYMTLGATVTNKRVCEGISGPESGGGVFMHGPTFMGNPLAAAVAVASLKLLLDSPWRNRVSDIHSMLTETLSPLSELEQVNQVRVLGAIGVCELKSPVRDMATVQKAFVEEGVWLRPFGKLLYTMPTFNCPDLKSEHIERIGSAMYKVARTL